MKLQIKCSNNWLKILLQQYFSNLEIIETAPIAILENSSSFHIISNDLKQDWHVNYPAPILSIVNILTQAQQSLEINIIKFGEVVFFPNKRLCIFKEEEISLTQKETEILLFLSTPILLHKEFSKVFFCLLGGFNIDVKIDALFFDCLLVRADSVKSEL
jgi:hypothetical protein